LGTANYFGGCVIDIFFSDYLPVVHRLLTI
jgi:hypothetical protein